MTRDGSGVHPSIHLSFLPAAFPPMNDINNGLFVGCKVDFSVGGTPKRGCQRALSRENIGLSHGDGRRDGCTKFSRPVSCCLSSCYCLHARLSLSLLVVNFFFCRGLFCCPGISIALRRFMSIHFGPRRGLFSLSVRSSVLVLSILLRERKIHVPGPWMSYSSTVGSWSS